MPLPLVRVFVAKTHDLDDDICGVSLSIRFGTNVVSVWNRVAPSILPMSAHSPKGGQVLLNKSLVLEETAERGVEKMKEVVLSGLSDELKPRSWFYRVFSSHWQH